MHRLKAIVISSLVPALMSLPTSAGCSFFLDSPEATVSVVPGSDSKGTADVASDTSLSDGEPSSDLAPQPDAAPETDAGPQPDVPVPDADPQPDAALTDTTLPPDAMLPDTELDSDADEGQPDIVQPPGPTTALVTLTLQEPAGVARTGAAVRTGVPLPQGLVDDPNKLVLLDATGEARPLQTRTLSTWPDGSARWVLLDTRVDLAAGELAQLTLAAADTPVDPQVGIVISESGGLITVDTGPVVLQVPTTDGRLVHSLTVDGVEVIGSGGAPEARGAWVTLQGGDTYYSSLLNADHALPSAATMQGYLDYVNDHGQDGGFNLYHPHDLSVTVEESGPLHAVVRISGAHRAASGEVFGSFITRLHAFAGSRKLQIQHTFVFTGDDDDQVASYGVRLPIAAADATATLVEGAAATTGEVAHLAWDSYLRLGQQIDGQALGWVARERAGAVLALTLPELAEAFPKALTATTDGLEAQLYASAAPAWNLSRYEDGTNGPGESDTVDGRGAQGLARTDWIGVHVRSGALNTAAGVELAAQATADDAGPLVLVAPPQWVSETGVMGVGPFHFDPSPASEPHYRVDRLLHVVADFMRYNQRIQFDWFGIENYGDIRGLFSGGQPPFDWFRLGRYGWSGNSGEPSNQLWLQYLRRPSRTVLTDAMALARHTMDVQMVHYADRESSGGSIWGGKNKEFSVGSLHRHGQQAWSGCAGFPEYSHVAGVETYYYLTGDQRARETLYEAAQFIARYGPTTPGYTAMVNGIDTLTRAAAVFWDSPQPATRFLNRASYLLDWVGGGQIDADLDEGSYFGFFLRGTPGLMYHHALTGDPRGAQAVLEAADWLTDGGGDTLSLAASPSGAGEFFQIGTLAYAKAIAADFGVDDTPYRDLLASIFSQQLHNVTTSNSGAVSLASLQAIPDDWRDWTWNWDEDPIDASQPGILWINRQITFRNDYMQDYHSYRAFYHLAVMAAALEL